MEKCICELEVGEEYNLDYTASWSYLGFKREEDGFYLMGHGDDLSVYKAKFCPECGKYLEAYLDNRTDGCVIKDCLSCANSFSESSNNGDILHCMERDGEIVCETDWCAKWN